jgi:hypothetical protein
MYEVDEMCRCKICREMHPRCQYLALSYDIIGWGRLMEGIISKECAKVSNRSI